MALAGSVCIRVLVGDVEVAVRVCADEDRLDFVAHAAERVGVPRRRHGPARHTEYRDDNEFGRHGIAAAAGSRTVMTMRRFRARSASEALPATKPVAPRPNRAKDAGPTARPV